MIRLLAYHLWNLAHRLTCGSCLYDGEYRCLEFRLRETAHEVDRLVRKARGGIATGRRPWDRPSVRP